MLWDLEQFKKKKAIITEDAEVTYYDLNKAANAFAAAIAKRCMIFLLAQNEIGSLIGYIGAINNRIIPVMLDSKLDDAFIKKLINNYKPEYLWIPETMQMEFSSFEKVYENYNYILVKTEFNSIEVHDELALLMTTSGSTGSPKLVRQSYKNILSNTNSIIEYLHISSEDKTITTLPMYYVYGLSIINTYLMSGATIILTNKTFFAKEFWQLVKDEAVTSISGVPYTYEMLNKLRFFRMELPALKIMTQAGGKLSKDLQRKFGEFALNNDKQFIIMYGAAEATSRMGYLPAEEVLNKSGSIGIAIPGGRFEIIDEEGRIISESGVNGELVYYGDNVCMGYAESADDLKRPDENNGFLHTGDIAYRDKDKYVYIVGRKKRFLKIFGKRISLDEIEGIIKNEFTELDVACAGKDDLIYIFILSEKLKNEVKKYIAEKTAINHAAIRVVVLEKFPLNEAGKIMYKDLVMYYE